jgi:alginate O-acetyltransferase complex protein AlgI
VLFTDVKFILLVVACWLSFASATHGRRGAALAVWGAVFYVLYAGPAAPLVFGLILVTWLVPAKYWMAPVAVTIGVLVYYKLGIREPAITSMLAATATPGSRVLVPLGLSFLSFELLHVAVERHRGRLERVAFGDFMAYALFFPCRVAGPIRRYPEFARSMIAARPSAASVYAGLIRVLVGVAKKVALADVLGLTVTEIAYAATPMHVIKVLLAYSFQIYLDFSAYSDMAIGISLMFGIIVPENFRSPYLSSNIQEFWTRWHISLSTWARDYVFLPLGQAAFATRLRKWPTLIAVLSYLTAFLVIGAWHGLSAPFVLWGLYHGVLLSLYHVYRRTIGKKVAGYPFAIAMMAKAAAAALTFAFVTAGWLLFLAPDLGEAARLLRLIAGRS